MTDATPHLVVTLDGVEHPIFMDEVTARQVMLVRQAFTMSPQAFPRMMRAEQAARDAGREPGSIVDLPEVAAMLYLARLQAEGPGVDVGEVLDSVKTGSKVKLGAPAAEVPDLDPPA